MARTIEIRQAFAWTCEDCGRDQFERAIVVQPEEIDPEDIPVGTADAEEIREWIEHGGSGDFLRAPASVRCRHCGAEFGTEDA